VLTDASGGTAEDTTVPLAEEDGHEPVTVEWEQAGFGAAIRAVENEEDSDASPSVLSSPEFTLPSVGAAFTWCVYNRTKPWVPWPT
jgi:hypothetical protein